MTDGDNHLFEFLGIEGGFVVRTVHFLIKRKMFLYDFSSHCYSCNRYFHTHCMV